MQDASSLKRPASEHDIPRKRQCRVVNEQSSPGPSPQTLKPPRRQKKKNTKALVWDDIPNEWTNDRCLFLELPVELLDKITGSGSGLELQDHISLSGTCRTLRNAYTEEVWKDLFSRAMNSAHSPMDRIFSRGEKVPQQQPMPDGIKASKEQHPVTIVSYHGKVIESVNTPRLTKTLAMEKFKVTAKDLEPLKFEERRNPRSRSHPIKLYRCAQLRALALRIHGGPLGHTAHIRKVTEKAEKSNATRVKNGTASKKKNPADSWDYDMTPDGDYDQTEYTNFEPDGPSPFFSLLGYD